MTGRSAGRTRATSSKPRTVASIASWSWAISHSSLTSRSSRQRGRQLAGRGRALVARLSYGRTAASTAGSKPRSTRVRAGAQLGQRRRPARSRSAVCDAQLGRPSRPGCAGGRPTARRSAAAEELVGVAGRAGPHVERRVVPGAVRAQHQHAVRVVLAGQVDEVAARPERVVGVVGPDLLAAGRDHQRLAGERRGQRGPALGVVGHLGAGRDGERGVAPARAA